MSNCNARDDSLENRLSSFLLDEGDLVIKKLYQIKPTVYKVVTSTNERYIIKGNKSIHKVNQQCEFFDKLSSTAFINQFVPFPNRKKILKGLGLFWVCIPYIDGDPLQYSAHKDRQLAVKTIKEFHTISQGIQLKQPLLKPPLYVKWDKRLAKLDQLKPLTERFGYKYLYQDIRSHYRELLRLFEQLDWHREESKCIELSMWIHGDVASHNFLKDTHDRVCLIDFDLLSLSPHIYDYIQLSQRFLPYVNWDVQQLSTYFNWFSEENYYHWLLGVTIPADMIREWWHFTRAYRDEQEYSVYLEGMSADWVQRKQFVEHVKTMLT